MPILVPVVLGSGLPALVPLVPARPGRLPALVPVVLGDGRVSTWTQDPDTGVWSNGDGDRYRREPGGWHAWLAGAWRLSEPPPSGLSEAEAEADVLASKYRGVEDLAGAAMGQQPPAEPARPAFDGDELLAKHGPIPDSDQEDDGRPPARGNRKLLFTPASTITPRPIVWAWDTTPDEAGPAQTQGRFPAGSFVLAVGRAGMGKSQFATWMAAQITRGTLPGCHHGTPRAVVYAAAEDSWEMTIVPRLIAAGADLGRVFHVRAVADDDPHARLTLPVDTALLGDGIAEHSVALVVADPLLSLIDATINDYRAREVRQALEPLVTVADRTRCLLLGLAHFTKATGSDPLMLVSGSGAFGQLIRAGVGFARDDEASDQADEDRFVLSQIKNNLGRENLPSLAYLIQPVTVDTREGPSHVSRFHFTGEESERSVRDLLRGAGVEDADERSEQDEAAEWIRDYLTADRPEREAPAGDALKAGQAAGFTVRTLQRARKRAGVRTQKSDFGGGWVWALPPEGATKAAKAPIHEGVSPSAPSLSPSTLPFSDGTPPPEPPAWLDDEGDRP